LQPSAIFAVALIDSPPEQRRTKMTTSKITLAVLALLLATGASNIPTQAAELPTAFLGSWTINDGASKDEVLTYVIVSPRYYKETGYNCPIKSITAKNDAESPDRGRVYIIDMSCGVDGIGAPLSPKVREVWALRKIDGKEVIVMSGMVGPSYPSIRVLQRRDW
jgi:hypothetical protein